MERIEDVRSRTVFNTAAAADIPPHVARRAWWVMNLLVAAASREDVHVIGMPTCFGHDGEREGIHIHGKWYVTYEWKDHAGPCAIRLERQ